MGIKLKHLFYHIAFLLLIVVFFCVAAELTLRIKGYKPWTPIEPNIRVEPGGRFFRKDPVLGYTHIPGTFRVILDDNYEFRVTHLQNYLRITHPLGTYHGSPAKPEIWIFGCSFVHGWLMNDEQTFPWLLQEKMPEHEIVNFGTGGYGTLQSLLQFKQAIGNRRPEVAVIVYGSFHDARNTFLRYRRKYVASLNKLGPLRQPYARLDRQGRLRYGMATVEYVEFPLMRRSALSHYIENAYIGIEDRLYDSHAVSKAIIKEFSLVCKEAGVPLIVAGIIADPLTNDMLEYCRQEGIRTADISVDLARPENIVIPGDLHPSASANRRYAEKLYAVLRAGTAGH